MNVNKTYRLAYSSCPNDTFIFKAIAQKRIDLNGYDFDIALKDVESLNQDAADGIHDITKLSFAAFGRVMDQYALLRSGAALGKGCGPLIISCPGRALSDAGVPVIAVPGMGTTAYLLFRFYMADCFPGVTFRVVPMPFEQIMPAVIAGTADFGVIIHEGRFVYSSLGLALQADLGQWWESATSLPIPLGCIAIKRNIDPWISCEIQSLIRQSIDHGFANPRIGEAYIRAHAQEMDDQVIAQHIALYVNDFSKDIGPDGERAVTAFFDRARDAGLIDASNDPIFAC